MKDRLPEESAVTLYVNGEKIVTWMTTPEKLRQLSLGYARNTGMIHALEEVDRIYACEQDSRLMMEGARIRPKIRHEGLILSACGQEPVTPPPNLGQVPSDLSFPIEDLQRAFLRMMRENQRYKETGGMHSAAMLNSGSFFLAEDVGRHNAQDKVVGMALEAGAVLYKGAIIGTGRLSSDMVIKAVISRVPVLASLSVPTNLAARLAEEYGVTLIGRIHRDEPIVYTHRERIQITE